MPGKGRYITYKTPWRSSTTNSGTGIKHKKYSTISVMNRKGEEVDFKKKFYDLQRLQILHFIHLFQVPSLLHYFQKKQELRKKLLFILTRLDKIVK